MIPPCLTLSNIRYISKVKWSNPGVAPSPTHRCCSYWKGSLLVTLDYGCQLFSVSIDVNDDTECFLQSRNYGLHLVFLQIGLWVNLCKLVLLGRVVWGMHTYICAHTQSLSCQGNGINIYNVVGRMTSWCEKTIQTFP